MKKKKKNKIKITQIKSAIGQTKKTQNTLKALGLKKNNQSIIKDDNPQIRGMVLSINHLLKIEKISPKDKK